MNCMTIATALALLLTTAAMAPAAVPKTIHLGAAQAHLSGTTIATSLPGYTGSGYITGFLNPADKVSFVIPDARPGLYDVRIRYSAPMTKGYNLVVNGAMDSGLFPPSGQRWAVHDAGDIELQAGRNTVEIQYGWGYYDINSIDFVPTTIPRLVRPSAVPCDPQATPQARALLAYLVRHYGEKTLSGQYNAADTAYIHQVTGQTPAIIGGDFMEYSPSRIPFGANPHHETEKVIAAAKAGQIVTMVWHWNAPADLLNTAAEPWYKGFYTAATTFSLKNALDNPQSKDYKLLLSNMDAIAVQLQKFQKAGIPVLWRPLHEAQGGWFWWGADGPGPFKKLWRLMYNRFTVHDHLHNLIWVDCSGTNSAWYPGSKYVDIIGIDEYPKDLTDPESDVWNTLLSEYGGRKLLALTEFGGVPDIPKMKQLGVLWSYFVSWPGTVEADKMAPAAVKAIYTSPDVINATRLPASIR
jgi:mannan endo-1,4-beta-mannosidase